MKIKFTKEKLWIFYCFFLSFIYLLLTSKNSFLYAFNEWGDANSFFTVGKSMFRGVIPYRDLFEQKGLLLYVIYGVGSLFSSTTFHGVFIVEVLFFTIFLYYLHKIISLFLNEKYSFLLLPVMSFLVLTSLSFSTGGSAEEFCLPMFSYTLYHFLKHFKVGLLTKKELFYDGLMAGMVFMIKYTMLGFWFAFMLSILIHHLLDKRIKEFFISGFSFLLGMFIPFGICSIYLLLNGAFMDFINCYFIVNFKYYSMSFSLLFRLRYIGVILAVAVFNSNFIVKCLFIWFTISLIAIKIDKYAKIFLLILFLLSHIGIYWGLKEFAYYFLPMYIFLIFSLIGICIFFRSIFEILIKDRKCNLSISNQCMIFGTLFFVILFVSYLFVPYKNDIRRKKGEFFQYQFAEYINTYDNPTLLNVGGLDMGVYTTSNIVPSTKFFHLMNFDYSQFPDNLDALKKSIKNQDVQFVVYTVYLGEKNNDYDFSNYDVIYKVRHRYESLEKDTYLLQLRNNT